MRIIIAAIIVLLSPPFIDRSKPIDEIQRDIREWVIKDGKPIMTATIINAPDTDTVPDGTTVTAPNSGFDRVTDVVGTATWRSYADGERYIEIAGTNKVEFYALDATAIDAATYFGWEYGIKYVLVDGQTLPADDNFLAMNVNPVSVEWRLHHRLRADENGVRITGTRFNAIAAALTTNNEDKTFGRTIQMGESIRFGIYLHHHASAGFLGATLDGIQVSHHGTGDTTIGGDSWDKLGRLTPRSGAETDCHITFPLKIWEDSTMLNELVPDRTSGDLGIKARMLDTLVDDIGPFSSTGGTSATIARYQQGGVTPKRQRFISQGASVNVELRAGNELGTLDRFSNTRSCIVFPMLYAPAGGSIRIRIGDSIDGDIVDIAFDGTSGSAGARQVELGGVATGLTYDQTHRYQLTLIFDDATNNSKFVLEDLTQDDGGGDQRLFTADWNRTGGNVDVNKIFFTVFLANCEFEPPFNPPTKDFLIVSSYTSIYSDTGDAEYIAPIFTVKSHIGNYLDHFADAGTRVNTGIISLNPFGRSGRALTDMDEAMNQYADFGDLEGCRLILGEWQVNDTASTTLIPAELVLMINAAKAAGMKILAGTSIPRPEGGSNSISDAYRLNQRLNNVTIDSLLTDAGRSDLFTIARVAEEYTDAAAATAFFTVGVDDVHFDAAGDALYASLLVSLQRSTGGRRSRDRSRQR